MQFHVYLSKNIVPRRKIAQSSFTHNIEIAANCHTFCSFTLSENITSDAKQEVKDKLAIFIVLKSWRGNCLHETSSLEHISVGKKVFHITPNTMRSIKFNLGN